MYVTAVATCRTSAAYREDRTHHLRALQFGFNRLLHKNLTREKKKEEYYANDTPVFSSFDASEHRFER